MHKSPYKGFSVEFANHRSYVPGDDIRHIDWRVYACVLLGDLGRCDAKRADDQQ